MRCPQIDTQQLDRQIKDIMTEVIPFLKVRKPTQGAVGRYGDGFVPAEKVLQSHKYEFLMLIMKHINTFCW